MSSGKQSSDRESDRLLVDVERGHTEQETPSSLIFAVYCPCSCYQLSGFVGFAYLVVAQVIERASILTAAYEGADLN
ncbi:hypothetical protein WJX77_006693 [Trebouxia sp. C0004]